MIIVSNHVKDKVRLNNDIVIRINVAWIKTLDELQEIIVDNAYNPIYLDYPEGRTKPPTPTLSMHDAISITYKYDNIKYFAISNAEEKVSLEMVRKDLPLRVKIIPKIETPKGCMNVKEICEGAETDTIMLDKEDLYTSLGARPDLHNDYMNWFKKLCKENAITILEMQGVIFYES